MTSESQRARPEWVDPSEALDVERVERLVAFGLEVFERRTQKVPLGRLVGCGACFTLMVVGVTLSAGFGLVAALCLSLALAIAYTLLLRVVLEVDDLPQREP